MLHGEEPWGETRADLRAWAHVIMGLGGKGLQLAWPYTGDEWTVAEIQAEMDRIEAAEQKAAAHGNRRENQHCD